MRNKQKLYSLQILRAVAALLVVLFHLSGSTKEIFKVEFLGDFFHFGSSGVDIFFVLSGFIICLTSWNKISSGEFKPFITKRIVRVYPIYWILITLMIVGLYAAGYQMGYSMSIDNLMGTYSLFPNHLMINGVSWSLSYEVYFYLIFGLLIIDKKFILIIIPILLLSIINYSFVNFFSSEQTAFNFLFSPNNIQFFLGALVGIITVKKIKMWPERWHMLIIVFTITSYFFFGYCFHNSHIDVLVYGLLTALFIIASVGIEKSGQFQPSNIFVRLGDASYVLYLIHIPILRIFFKLVAGQFDLSILQISIMNIVIIVFISYLSIVIHDFIEKPVIRLLKSKIN